MEYFARCGGVEIVLAGRVARMGRRIVLRRGVRKPEVKRSLRRKSVDWGQY
jgi:hypothetical protein